MSRGRPAPRAKRKGGWLSGAKKAPKGGGTPLWQWIVGVPAVILLFSGILLFVYIAWLHPTASSGRTLTVLVLDRIEKLDASGRLDTTASYLEVSVEGTRFRVAPKLPDWNRIAKGDLIDVDTTGSGPTLAILAWHANSKPAGDPAPAR